MLGCKFQEWYRLGEVRKRMKVEISSRIVTEDARAGRVLRSSFIFYKDVVVANRQQG